jgi:hypothetical protein
MQFKTYWISIQSVLGIKFNTYHFDHMTDKQWNILVTSYAKTAYSSEARYSTNGAQ